MSRHDRLVTCVALMMLAIFTFGIEAVCAADKHDMQGWGINDPYNKHYDVREYEKFRGWVLKVTEVVPMPGMAPATALLVREGSEEIEVHLCPTWYRKPSEIGVKPGDRIKLKGVWAYINGKDVFMASKIKKDPDIDVIKVRLTKDGTPFWTMTADQLAQETSSDD